MGHINILQLLREYGYNDWPTNFCEQMIQAGQLSVINWSKQNGYIFDEHDALIAIQNGNIENSN